MNNLCQLAKLKTDEAGVASTVALDDVLKRTADAVSREFERETGRSFVATYGARYLQRRLRAPGAELALDDDLATLTEVKVDEDGDGTYELTLAENSDYWVEREDDLDANTPIVLLRLNPNGTQLSSWPSRRRAVKVTGYWGYSYETEATGLTINEAAGDGANADATETSITLSGDAEGTISPGDTVVVESEQMGVVSVAGPALTVVRGINGTTAATHANGVAVTVRRYPRDVEQAVAERVVGIRWDVQTGHAGMISLGGESEASGVSAVRASYARWRRAVNAYKRLEVA